MKFNAVPTAMFIISTLCGLASCSSGKVDVRYPTAQQLDDLDVQWGLPRRVSRGNPSRTYTHNPATAPHPSSSTYPATGAAPALPDPPLDSVSTMPQIPDQLR